MLSDGAMIVLIFGGIVLIPFVTVLIVLAAAKKRRKRKYEKYRGMVLGTVTWIRPGGIDHPSVIHAVYHVNGKEYQIKETAKLKSRTIKVGKIPVGQKKSFVMGAVAQGDQIWIRYDERRPERAIICGNDGVVTG